MVVSEKRSGLALRYIAAMFTDIAVTPMYVTDQDAAVEFYVDKLGFVVDTDVDLGNMRWLTVVLPSAPKRMVLLQRIGDETATASRETAGLLRELTERGTSSWMILESDDVDADFTRLQAANVEIIDEPTTRPYGRDRAVRDPCGNPIRMKMGRATSRGRR